MDTLIPAIARGRTERFADVLPDDEYRARVTRLQQAMRDRDLSAVVAFSDRRDYAAVCYFSGVVPRESVAAVMVPAAGPPRLFMGLPSTRDLPALRDCTWISDVHLFDDLWQVLDGRGTSTGRIGFALQSRAASWVHRRIAEISGSVPAGQLVETIICNQRPREHSLMRDLVTLTARATAVARALFLSGASAREAMIEAELLARRQGAHDVRTLTGADRGMTLKPIAGSADERPASFVHYIAIERLGYRTEQLGTTTADHDALAHHQTAIDRVIRALRTGGIDELPAPPHPVIASRPLARLGIAYAELERVPDRLPDGFYSIRHGGTASAGAILLSTTVDVTGGEVEVLGE